MNQSAVPDEAREVFLAALILYCAAVAAVLLAPWWPLQIACAILAGLFIATSFVVGHDACHGRASHPAIV